MSDVGLFWSRVEKTDDCWLWRGPLNRGGYGVQGRRLAHRAAYELIVGPIPAGLQIDHLCRVKRCVRPSHLEPTTAAVNLARSSEVNGRGVNTSRCAHDHALTPENTYRRPNGRRYCRACHRAAAAKAYQDRKTA